MVSTVKDIILNKKYIDGTEAGTLKRYLYQSHLILRRTVGILALVLAIGLPVVDFIINHKIESSISSYYHTEAKDIFVGILCVVGAFLISYRSYKYIENVLTSILGALAIGIAFIPSTPHGEVSHIERLMGDIHTGLAVIFFVIFAILTRLMFKKDTVDVYDAESEGAIECRNLIYDMCNLVMVLNGVVCLITYLMGFREILVFESIALVVFGIAWIVKGKMIRILLSKSEYEDIVIK